MMAVDKLHGRKTLKVNNFLDEFEKDDVKKYVDIVDLFSHFGIILTKKGKSYMAKCPWHNDTNPSLSVDRDKGVYNCFGCGESGDIFTLTEKMKGIAFKEVLAWLKDEYRNEGRGSRVGGREKAEELGTSSPESGGLTAVAEYYHKKLYENPKALEYLHKRGLVDLQLYDRLKIGFADGSLLNVIGETQRKEFTETGILTERGSEHFKNCVIFPIFDDLGQVVGMYGRLLEGVELRVSSDESGEKDNSSPVTRHPKHLYLKGNHKGVFHRKASKVYDEIILTESIIDALSLIELGIQNVQAIYGTNGFTEEHLQILKDDRVKTVVLALDSDEAGKSAAEKLKEKLLGEGFAVKVIFPLTKKDWNEELVSGSSGDSIKETITKAETFKIDLASAIRGSEAPASVMPPAGHTSTGVSVSKDAQAYAFTIGEIVYKVDDVKDFAIGNSRVRVKAAYADNPSAEKYYDRVDLFSARSRATYSSNLSREFGFEAKRIEKDLIVILEYLEAERDRKLARGADGAKFELTDEERALGMKFLTAPDIFDQIDEDMEIMGYAGDRLNKLLMYIAATSRIQDDPVGVWILSQSASGKTLLAETTEKLMPEEDVISVTSLSDQALNYASDLMHKFLVLGEAVHSPEIERDIRDMLSSKRLSRFVAMKDEKTGKTSSEVIKIPAIVSAVMTGTSTKINPENASRCFIINTDESGEQTKRIHAAQSGKYDIARIKAKKRRIPEIVKKHHAAQRLLVPRTIENSYASELNFPHAMVRTRRDHERFLDLIAGVCFLRQYQKEIKRDEDIEYISCDDVDYAIAFEIMMGGALESTLREITAGTASFYETFRGVARDAAKKERVKPAEVRITVRDIRESAGLSNTWIKEQLRILVDYEYIIREGSVKERSRGFYRLRADEPMESLDLSMIPTPEEMKKRINAKKENK